MKAVAAILLLGCTAALARPLTEENYRWLFGTWMGQHGKQYATGEEQWYAPAPKGALPIR